MNNLKIMRWLKRIIIIFLIFLPFISIFYYGGLFSSKEDISNLFLFLILGSIAIYLPNLISHLINKNNYN
jgi:uncharacterized membrane protein